MKELTLQSYQELFGDRFDFARLPAPLLAEKEDYTLPRRQNNTHKYSYDHCRLRRLFRCSGPGCQCL